MKKKVNWQDKELITKIVKENLTKTEILTKLGLSNGCGNNQTLLKYIRIYNIDISHLSGNEIRITKLKEMRAFKTISNEEYFINNISRNNNGSKRRILKDNLKEHKCDECNCPPEWNGKTLILQLDHINGDNFDNRLENLRLLCPNCHSQTITFAGKKHKTEIKKEIIFDIVEFEKERKAPSKEEIQDSLEKLGIKKTYLYFKMGEKSLERLCEYYKIDLKPFKNRFKIDWPNLEEMQKLLLKDNFTNLVKILGVSDKAINKHAEKNKLFIPTSITQGYWISKTINRVKFEDLVLENGEYKLRNDYDINTKVKVQSLKTIS